MIADADNYIKTGNSKIFEPGEHIMIELVPIMPRISIYEGREQMRIPKISPNIPKEYTLSTIKEVPNDFYGNFLAVVTVNKVTVEAEE